MPKRPKIDHSQDSSELKKTKKNHWSLGLLDAINDPKLLVQSDDLVNIIRDKYPKSEHHYLIIPKKEIKSLKEVTEDDLHILKHMDLSARKLIESKNIKNRTFKIGYHAEPSMSALHLHVLSDDMNSPCMRTKKHWNSFTTKFFIPSETIITNVHKKINIVPYSSTECKQLLELALKCHKCDYIPKNMPDLKKHIVKHLQVCMN